MATFIEAYDRHSELTRNLHWSKYSTEREQEQKTNQFSRILVDEKMQQNELSGTFLENIRPELTQPRKDSTMR